MLIQDATILVIDDEPFELLVINEKLSNMCKNIILQSNIEMALALADIAQPNIILLDINMPVMNGYKVCNQLKSNISTKDIPIIFCSSCNDSSDRVKAFEVGGVDYITKPIHAKEIIIRIESCLKLHREIQQSRQNIKKIQTQNNNIDEKIKQYQLSEREIKILVLYAGGHTYNEIARQLPISEHTVKWYLKNIFKKLAINNRSEAIKKAYEIGLISL